jgi:hypothetical protein
MSLSSQTGSPGLKLGACVFVFCVQVGPGSVFHLNALQVVLHNALAKAFRRLRFIVTCNWNLSSFSPPLNWYRGYFRLVWLS